MLFLNYAVMFLAKLTWCKAPSKSFLFSGSSCKNKPATKKRRVKFQTEARRQNSGGVKSQKSFFRFSAGIQSGSIRWRSKVRRCFLENQRKISRRRGRAFLMISGGGKLSAVGCGCCWSRKTDNKKGAVISPWCFYVVCGYSSIFSTSVKFAYL